MLYIGFGDQGAIDELLVTRPPCEDSSALEPSHDGGNSRLRQLSLGVQLLPDLRDGELALFPEQAKDGDLELGELLAVRHQDPRGLYTCRFYTCRTNCQGESFRGIARSPERSASEARQVRRDRPELGGSQRNSASE